MRAIPGLLVAGVLLVAIDGCGGQTAASTPAMPTVTGKFGTKPAITVPAAEPPKTPQTVVLSEGNGPATKPGQRVIAHVTFKLWKENRDYMSTHDSTQPTSLVLDPGQFAPAFIAALTGKKAGTRVLVVSPAPNSFGAGRAPAKVSPTETVIDVLDIVGGYDRGATVPGPATGSNGPVSVAVEPGRDPVVTVAAGAKPPTTLVAADLVQGTGPAIKLGDIAVVQYVGVSWSNTTEFDSSYRRGAPNGFVIDSRSTVPGWSEGLVGHTVGSRVLLVVPAAMGEGFTGTPAMVTAPQGDNIYVVDILGVHQKP